MSAASTAVCFSSCVFFAYFPGFRSSFDHVFLVTMFLRGKPEGINLHPDIGSEHDSLRKATPPLPSAQFKHQTIFLKREENSEVDTLIKGSPTRGAIVVALATQYGNKLVRSPGGVIFLEKTSSHVVAGKLP